MAQVVKRAAASIDLDKIAAYLTQERSTRTAIRFLDAADQAMRNLADMPLIGGPWEGRNSSFADMRTWPIRRFRNYIIYYRPIRTGIEVIRVLHGAQDVESIFGETE